MCIDELEFRFPEKNKMKKTAFKVLEKRRDLYRSPMFQSKMMQIGKHYRVPEFSTDIDDDDFGDNWIRSNKRIFPRCFDPKHFNDRVSEAVLIPYYRRGFHAIMSIEDAKDYLQSLRNCSNAHYVICVVALDDITGTGTEFNPICREPGEGNRHMDVVVGTGMTILKEISEVTIANLPN